MRKFTIIVICLIFISTSCKKDGINQRKQAAENINPILDALRFNQLQTIGSHNSYRRKTDADIFKLVSLLSGILPADLDPKAWDYDQVSLTDQMNLGLRSLELDIYYDPKGGLYYQRKGNALVGKNIDSGINDLLEPGMKMMHVPDFDYNSWHYTFKGALKNIKKWSDEHPLHLPIVLLVEFKETGVGNIVPLFTKVLPFTEQAVNDVDLEIIDVFGTNNPKLFKPDDLRKNYPNLKTAIETEGWPQIKDMRGKILFVFYPTDKYTKGHPNLEGRMMFQFSPLGSPNGAFVKMDDSKDIAEIQNAVKAGAIIRTRADGDTKEARTGDITTRENAFNSGAQIISTDYYIPDPRAGQKGWTDYEAIFPTQNYARVNIINAPEELKGKKIVE